MTHGQLTFLGRVSEPFCTRPLRGRQRTGYGLDLGKKGRRLSFFFGSGKGYRSQARPLNPSPARRTGLIPTPFFRQASDTSKRDCQPCNDPRTQGQSFGGSSFLTIGRGPLGEVKKTPSFLAFVDRDRERPWELFPHQPPPRKEIPQTTTPLATRDCPGQGSNLGPSD